IAVDSPDPTSQVTLGCPFGVSGFAGPGGSSSQFPGLPAARFVAWGGSMDMFGIPSLTCYGAWTGETTSAQTSFATASRMSGVRITAGSLVAGPSRVTFGWSAPPDAASFLVFVLPYPFTFTNPRTWQAAQLLPGSARSVDFRGLVLDTTRQYTAAVFAFSGD